MSDCLFGVLLILVVLVVLARGLHPVSFPNLEVKPFCADGTATGGLWESRALPTVSLSVVGVFGPCLGGRHPHHFFCLCFQLLLFFVFVCGFVVCLVWCCGGGC